MRYRVHAHAGLRHYVAGGAEFAEVEVDGSPTVATILRSLGIPDDQVLVVRVGARIVRADHVAADGDVIEAFPIVDGG